MSRLIYDSANDDLDMLLEELCLTLGLTKEQFKRAERAYQTVGDWLDAPESSIKSLRPRVFPQGSIPLGTAVRPHDENGEFDADGVCLLQAGSTLSPQEAYDFVYQQISEHAEYRKRLSREDRCIRVNYEGAMHLDIIAAIPSNSDERRILIPSADRTAWQSSDPEGYIVWFRNKSSQSLSSSELMEVRADAEPMPPYVPDHNKSPLQRVVQLFKRRRDVTIEDELKPKSILLTTLVAEHWGGEQLASDGLISVLEKLKSCFPIGSSPVKVANPTDKSENLARQWIENRESYDVFTRFIVDFHRQIKLLEAAQGMDRVASALNELFDPHKEGFVKEAVSRYTTRFQSARESSSIYATSTATSRNKISIPKNQFYGKNVDPTKTSK